MAAMQFEKKSYICNILRVQNSLCKLQFLKLQITASVGVGGINAKKTQIKQQQLLFPIEARAQSSSYLDSNHLSSRFAPMASIDGESLELEVKHKVNGSWHPCQVSLSSNDSKFGIIVKLENSKEEDIISSREDAFTRLRCRSTPLQAGECSHIKEGDHVLALYKDQFRSMLFDAVIEKPYRVKHSNRVFCRCTFEIKWLIPDMEEESMTLSSKSIMKLSGKEIDSHPIFDAFLNALSPKDEEEVPSFLSCLEEINYEADVLEKQIEEISKFADEPVECSAGLLEAKRASLGGRKQNKAAITSHRSPNSNQINSRRSTRSQNKEQVEAELNNNKELEVKNKPFLSPLAARAALASLVVEHEFPVMREISFSHIEKESQDNLPQKDSKKHIKVHSLKSEREIVSTLTVVNNSIDSQKAGQLSAQSTTTRVTRSSVNKEIEVLSDKVKPTSPEITKRKTRTSVHKETEEQGSSMEKLTNPLNATRVTRSRIQKEQSNPSLDHCISEISESTKGSSSTVVNNPKLTRVTRSSVHKEIETSLEEAKVQSPHTARFTRSRNTDLIGDIHEVSEDVVPPMRESRMKRSISSEFDPAQDSGYSYSRVSNALEESENASSEKKKVISSKKPALRSSPRFTRSQI